MTSIKVKFRPSTDPCRQGVIYYQIIHLRRIRQLSTDLRIMPDEWDNRRSAVTIGKDVSRKQTIHTIRQLIREDLWRLTRIVQRLSEERLAYSADDVVEEFRHYTRNYTLSAFMGRLITEFRKVGKIRTSETYRAALNSFSKFRSGKEIMLDCLTSEMMEEYEAWHRQKGNSSNTISFYTRILRAVYNRAADAGIVNDRQPFRHVYTGVDKTVKRALTLQRIRAIRSLDLSCRKTLDYARDMFMMSFYLRGMSFVDMAFLKKSDLKKGSLIYRRRKTGQQLTIGWTHEMQAILDKYPANPTHYLLPIICRHGINERCAYLNAGYRINRDLKQIGHLIGITIPLTMYVARHSWASAARSKGIPLSVISEGMGHDSEATTRIYLASLSSSAVDRANSIILSSL